MDDLDRRVLPHYREQCDFQDVEQEDLYELVKNSFSFQFLRLHFACTDLTRVLKLEVRLLFWKIEMFFKQIKYKRRF